MVLEEEGVRVTQGVMLDVTRQKAAQQELEESLALLRRTDEHRRKLAALLADSQEAERRRLAGSIHDDPIQKMTAAGLRLQALRNRVPDEHREALDRIAGMVSGAVDRLRWMLFELHPPSLEREGLAAALEEYLRESAESGGFSYSLEDRMGREPPPATRAVAYRIAQEAVTNVGKHARATRVEVGLETRNGGLSVTVRDDGRGFTPSEVEEPRPGHLGLQSMRERAELAGGSLRVESAPGSGTRIELWLPEQIAGGGASPPGGS